MSTNNDFLALRLHADGAKLEPLTMDDLNSGQSHSDESGSNGDAHTVVIRPQWSDVNFKDALAVTGKGKIARRFPLVAGIDCAGVVEASTDEQWVAGDEVLVTGCELSETLDGGYSEVVRVPADAVIKRPNNLSLRDCMAIGTAGFTAALAVHRMEANGQTPDMGPIAVTGATGGVGSIAVDLLSQRGYDVHAITGKAAEQREYLTAIGANEVVDRTSLELGSRPLEKALWGGAVDNLGGDMLSWLTRTTHEWGNVATIGLAASHKLETSVMPFILRGVNLLGIHSVTTPRALRETVWARLNSDLKPQHLDTIVAREVPLADAMPVFEEFMSGRITGRTLIKIG